MSVRNEGVPKNIFMLTALHRARTHDAPIRRRSRFYFKIYFEKFSIVAEALDGAFCHRCHPVTSTRKNCGANRARSRLAAVKKKHATCLI
jgi:hypothetical protein